MRFNPKQEGPYNKLGKMVLNDDVGCKFIFADEGTARKITQESHCGKVVPTTDPFASVGLSMIVPKHWEKNKNLRVVKDLEYETLRLNQLGVLPTVEEFFKRGLPCVLHADQTVTVDKLKYFFIIVFSVSGLLLLFTALEYISKTRRRKDTFEKKVAERVSFSTSTSSASTAGIPQNKQ